MLFSLFANFSGFLITRPHVVIVGSSFLQFNRRHHKKFIGNYIIAHTGSTDYCLRPRSLVTAEELSQPTRSQLYSLSITLFPAKCKNFPRYCRRLFSANRIGRNGCDVIGKCYSNMRQGSRNIMLLLPPNFTTIHGR